eukprot:COSAG01_NODE_13008_length_1650_cov_1.055448_2_plen_132_part_01
MMLGGFDMTPFRNSPTPFLAVFVFIVFMGITAVILLNAVIAIMSSTFERANNRRDSVGMLEKAQVILDMELLMIRTADKSKKRTGSCQQALDVVKMLLSWPILHYVPAPPIDTTYLHHRTTGAAEKTSQFLH